MDSFSSSYGLAVSGAAYYNKHNNQASENSNWQVGQLIWFIRVAAKMIRFGELARDAGLGITHRKCAKPACV